MVIAFLSFMFGVVFGIFMMRSEETMKMTYNGVRRRYYTINNRPPTPKPLIKYNSNIDKVRGE